MDADPNAELPPDDPRVLEYVDYLHSRGNRIGPRQRRFLERWELTPPYDHPWREAQVALHEAERASSPVRYNYDPLTAAIQFGEGRSIQEITTACQRYFAMLDELQSKVSTAYVVGINLMKRSGATLKLVSVATELTERQLKDVPSRPAGTLDVLKGLTGPEDYWGHSGIRDAELIEVNSHENQPNVAILAALSDATDLVRQHILDEKRGRFGNGRYVILYFKKLRNVAAVIAGIREEIIVLLRRRGYSWRRIGEITFESGQSAFEKYRHLG